MLIETVIAITFIFGSLLALAYTATSGFGYQDAARQRQTANGIANQLMEKVRGLSTTQLQTGLLTTDVPGLLSTGATDSRISGSPYQFVPEPGCTASSAPGCKEWIISGSSQSAFPLNHHLWCTAAAQILTVNHVDYSCGTFVTRATTTTPYRVTVIVTWTGGARGPNKVVQIQSLFTSAPGCASSTNHPYAGTCQPFFNVQATEPSANIAITGTAGATTIGGALIAPGATATEQTEQASSLTATVRTAGATLTGASTPSAGNLTISAGVDDNPDTSILTDSRQRCGTEVMCTAPSSPSLSTTAGTFSMSIPGTSGESDSTTTAGSSGVSGVTPVCPTSVTADTDKLPCLGATATMSSNLASSLAVSAIGTTTLGTVTLANIATPSAATTVYADRQFATGYGCTSPISTIGCVGASATRTLGDITLGYLPSTSSPSWTIPSGWTGFLMLTNYSDALSASVGTGAAVGTPSRTGTIKCWKASTSAYLTANVTDTNLNALLGCSYAGSAGTGTNRATISMAVTSVTAGSVSTAPTPAVPTTVTSALAQVVPPTVTITYAIDASGTSNDVALTITASLGAAKIQGTYTAAPTGP
jgi:hypothetical protein